MQPASILIKRPVKIIDGHPLAFQKAQAIVAVDIISWVYAVNGNRMVSFFHFPHDRCHVVYIVKVPDEKQVHIFYPLTQPAGRRKSAGCLT